MLNANLLPSEQKQAVYIEDTRNIVRFFAFGIIGVLSAALLTLLPFYIWFAIQTKDAERFLLAKEEAFQGLEIEATTARIAEMKDTVADVQAFLPRAPKAFQIVEVVSEDLGADATIRNLAVKNDRSISVSGFAATRNDLLDFEGRLRSSGRFQDITSPLSNIIRETDIEFSLRGTLDPAFGLWGVEK